MTMLFRDSYFLPKLYRARLEVPHFADGNRKDEWQREVYLHARALMDQHGYHRVVDVGCGSGFKLMKYFPQEQTVGLEVEPTLSLLRARYPDRDWRSSNFSDGSSLATDVVICADVIEHLLDPAALLDFICSIPCRCCVLSTPAREINDRPWHRVYWGPPANPHHVREWTVHEFRQFVATRFEVLESVIPNREQSTHMVVCRKKS